MTRRAAHVICTLWGRAKGGYIRRISHAEGESPVAALDVERIHYAYTEIGIVVELGSADRQCVLSYSIGTRSLRAGSGVFRVMSGDLVHCWIGRSVEEVFQQLRMM